jgi:hypothetical protein
MGTAATARIPRVHRKWTPGSTRSPTRIPNRFRSRPEIRTRIRRFTIWVTPEKTPKKAARLSTSCHRVCISERKAKSMKYFPRTAKNATMKMDFR